MERRQPSASVIEKHAELTEPQMVLMARVRGIGVLMSSIRGNARMEFINRGVNAATNIRRCSALQTRPAEHTRANVIVMLLRLQVCMEKL